MLFRTKTVGALDFNFVSRWRYIKTFHVVNVLSVPVKSTQAKSYALCLKYYEIKSCEKGLIAKSKARSLSLSPTFILKSCSHKR